MTGAIKRIAIVGGGTAGWLSACFLAARRPDLEITLVESPDIPTIGVGEGTWPTMRETLATIGISEPEFLRACDASFKQGSRFDGWRDGTIGDSYLHPFSLPISGPNDAVLGAWQASGSSFAAAVTAQAAVCAADLAPRQRAMPDYAAALNYGYHLDAGKFARLLSDHATRRLGVTRLAATVRAVEAGDNGDIAAIRLDNGMQVAADLFLDCTGQACLLIAGHFGVDWIDRGDISFNDRALAVQVPVAPGSPIAAQTIGTAHAAGWLWDIALPRRRGIGCVYASRFMADDEAERVLRDYVSAAIPGSDLAALAPRRLEFRTGHRAKFWQGNCLAIGLSAGFIEPLEASAIVLIELSLRSLADNFPASRAAMDIHAERFNQLFTYRWERIVEFLKLHYVLSRRPEPYWQAQRDPAAIPSRLSQNLTLWRDQAPSAWDFPQVDEIFSAASQQYVLYGMGFPPPSRAVTTPAAQAQLDEVRERARILTAALPTNRAYLDTVAAEAA